MLKQFCFLKENLIIDDCAQMHANLFHCALSRFASYRFYHRPPRAAGKKNKRPWLGSTAIMLNRCFDSFIGQGRTYK